MAFFNLLIDIFSAPFPWNVWVTILGLMNVVAGFYFFKHLEGKLSVLCMVLTLSTMTFLYWKLGFVRLLGLAHIYWLAFIPRLTYVALKKNPTGLFKKWIYGTIIVDSISVIIDTIDVIRYLTGETGPVY